MTDFREYENLQRFIDGRSGLFVAELENLQEHELQHLNELLSVVDMDHERYSDWLDGEFQSVLSELHLLYVMRSSFSGVETKKSPDGTQKDFDLYFEYDGVPIYVEIKTRDILDEIEGGGNLSPTFTPDQIWNYVRQDKFLEVDTSTSDRAVLLLGLGLLVPPVQKIAIERFPSEAVENWTDYTDGLLTFYLNPKKDLSFGLEYYPLTERGTGISNAFDRLTD